MFGTEGYSATSTSKIAQQAGVSEGLIFRHFVNKEGLLKAIFNQAEEKFKVLYANLILQSQPKSVIQKMIELPMHLDDEEIEFWRLQYRLKWELQYSNPAKIQPIIIKLTWAFDQLGYDSPTEEAEFLNNYIEGLASQTLLGRPMNKEKTKEFLFKKYHLTS